MTDLGRSHRTAWYVETGQIILCSFREIPFFHERNLASCQQGKIVQFSLDSDYDRSKTIIIDPLIYSTFIGGSNDDMRSSDCVLDRANNTCIVGRTLSSDFPIVNGYNNNYSGAYDVFVCKLSADGTNLVYSTFIGGNNNDYGSNIALDSNDNIYISGYTDSSDFPTVNGYDSNHNGYWDAFVCKLSADGTNLIYSTFLGGSQHEVVYCMKLGKENDVCISGYTESGDFPTANAYDDTYNGKLGSSVETGDVFLSRLSSDGTNLLYSTYIGGVLKEHPSDILLDDNDNIYLTGYSRSPNFPIVNAFDDSHNGGMDVFVCKLSSDGSSLLYSTFIGGSNDEHGCNIVLDNDNTVFISGWTYSTDFPTINAYDDSHNGGMDIFICKLSSDGTIVLYSTFFGGSNNESTLDLILITNLIIITGYTMSYNFPTMNAYDNTYNGAKDVFLSCLSDDGTSLLYSTFIGGNNDDEGRKVVADSVNTVSIIGYTASSTFPTINAYDDTHNGGYDVFVCKLLLSSESIPTDPIPTIIYPNGGEILKGTAIVQWMPVNDTSRQEVLYVVSYSSDNGLIWNILAIDLVQSYYVWDTRSVLDGSDYLVKVVVLNFGNGNGTDISDTPFSIQNNQEIVTVTTTVSITPGWTLITLMGLFIVIALRSKYKQKYHSF